MSILLNVYLDQEKRKTMTTQKQLTSRETTKEEVSIIEKSFQQADLKTKKAWNKNQKQASIFNAIALAVNNVRKQNGLSHY